MLDVFMLSSRAIMDATSLLELRSCLAHICDCIVGERIPQLESLAFRSPIDAAVSQSLASLQSDRVSSAASHPGAAIENPMRAPYDGKPVGHRHERTVIDADDMRGIKAVAHAQGSSVDSLLLAAFALAIGEVFPDYLNYPKSFGSKRQAPVGLDISGMQEVTFRWPMLQPKVTGFAYALRWLKKFPDVSVSIYEGRLIANTVCVEEFIEPAIMRTISERFSRHPFATCRCVVRRANMQALHSRTGKRIVSLYGFGRATQARQEMKVSADAI